MDDRPMQPLRYPLGDALPGPAQMLQVAPGVHWIRMPLPFALDHINLWLLRDRLDGRDGWTVVDCGLGGEATMNAWAALEAQAMEGLPVLRVLVTHMHPDHLGAAAALCERWSTPAHPCRLWISTADYHVARVALDHPTGHGGERGARFLQSHGLCEGALLAEVRAQANPYARLVPGLPDSFRRLADGDTLEIGGNAWRCLAGHGHAPEHIALHAPHAGVLISGDMVLPRISTNVSVYPAEPEGDPLAMFLASLDRMRALPPDTLVLPSHGKPFAGLHTRLDALRDHHAARLDDALRACAERPHSAHDLLPTLFSRPMDGHTITFAMAEAIAHLNLLWHAGRLVRSRGADGVWRFAAA